MTDRDIWMRDTRPIVAAKLAEHPQGIMLAIGGFVFERFERSGEMASIPFLRATFKGTAIEAALRQWDWVEFAEEEQPHG